MKYDVEVVGLITVDASSKDEAIELARKEFEEENITWEDLSFSCDDDE